MKKIKTLIFAGCLGVVFAVSGITASAQTTQLEDGTVFDSEFYANTYADVKAAYGTDFNALLNHYLTYGIKEGRTPSAGSSQTITLDDGTVFDANYYASTYPDVKAALGTDVNALLNHYLTYGIREGRSPSGSGTSTAAASTTSAAAASTGRTVTLSDGTVFDADYYAATYPDVKAAFGTDFDALLNHYLTCGINEGRKPSAESAPASTTASTATTATVTSASLVSIDSLENLTSLKKKCTDAEFQAAYDAAANIVTPLLGLSLEDQLYGIASAIRYMFDSGQVMYTTSVNHYNDPYGYFVAGVGSCAGCTRATGLCLNMLGISYEHVNENQWSHQWCRVNVNGTYWICDAYGLYVGPEPAPYTHPYL